MATVGIEIFYGDPAKTREYQQRTAMTVEEAQGLLTAAPAGWPVGLQFGAYTGPAFDKAVLMERVERAALGGTPEGRAAWRAEMRRLVEALP